MPKAVERLVWNKQPGGGVGLVDSAPIDNHRGPLSMVSDRTTVPGFRVRTAAALAALGVAGACADAAGPSAATEEAPFLAVAFFAWQPLQRIAKFAYFQMLCLRGRYRWLAMHLGAVVE
jgi:hypothetical protein